MNFNFTAKKPAPKWFCWFVSMLSLVLVGLIIAFVVTRVPYFIAIAGVVFLFMAFADKYFDWYQVLDIKEEKNGDITYKEFQLVDPGFRPYFGYTIKRIEKVKKSLDTIKVYGIIVDETGRKDKNGQKKRIKKLSIPVKDDKLLTYFESKITNNGD